MPRRKKSFFERLTGGINTNDDDDRRRSRDPYDDEYGEFDDEFARHPEEEVEDLNDEWSEPAGHYDDPGEEFEEGEGELAVDVYETPEHIVVQAMVAGVRPDALDVSITREKCVIQGRREAPRDASPDEYIHQELYWGSFSRSVHLPEEVEVEESNASEDHGLLTIKLPKIKKDQETKLEIQTE